MSFSPCLGILSFAQRRLWPELQAASRLGFVLYGGTAIALRLRHRPSVDFDFFSENPLDREAIKAAFPFLSLSTVVQDEANSLSLLVPDGDLEHSHVRVSFFGVIGFGRVGHPEMTDDNVMQVASLDDLMATKVKVVLQRAEAKDYSDVAAMINAGVSLAKGLASAREIFGPNFQPSESLKALVYFADGDLETLPESAKTALIKSVSAVRDLPVVTLASKHLCIDMPAINAEGRIV